VWRGPLVRLVRADGTAFDLPPPAVDGDAKGEQEEQEEERGASSDSGRASPPRALYERVLVDAECTHDGSLKHIAKFGAQWVPFFLITALEPGFRCSGTQPVDILRTRFYPLNRLLQRHPVIIPPLTG